MIPPITGTYALTIKAGALERDGGQNKTKVMYHQTSFQLSEFVTSTTEFITST